MREILVTQQKHIAETAKKLEAYWTKRLLMLEQEMNSEPERIQELYQVKAKRIEPIGLVYFWPVTG